MTNRSTLWTLIAILALGAGLRLVGIGNPLIGHHSWRQTDTAAVARNFVEEDFNILHPRIDWRGTSSGEVECEFPIYQFAIATLYKVVGVREWVGRLLSILLSLATLAGMFLLSKRLATPAVGLWSAFFLAILPMPLFFGRAVMPESLLLACCVYSVLLFVHWSRSSSLWPLMGSAICLAVACLLKPPTLYLGLPLAFLAIAKLRFRALRRWELWLYAVVPFAALALWYHHAHTIEQATGLTFGVWEYGSDKWGNWELLRTWNFWEKIFIQRVPHLFLSYLGLPLLVVGLVKARHTREEAAFSLWLAGMLVLVVVVAKGVFVHDYYLLPATVPAAFYMGKAAAWGCGTRKQIPRWAFACIVFCIIAVAGVSLATHFRWLRKEAPSKSEAYQAAKTGRELLPKNSLVVACDKGDPMLLYYSHTKGWKSFPRDLTERWVADRRKEGAAYLLGVHADFDRDGATRNLSRLLSQHPVVANNGRFFIVSTAKKGAEDSKGGNNRSRQAAPKSGVALPPEPR